MGGATLPPMVRWYDAREMVRCCSAAHCSNSVAPPYGTRYRVAPKVAVYQLVPPGTSAGIAGG